MANTDSFSRESNPLNGDLLKESLIFSLGEEETSIGITKSDEDLFSDPFNRESADLSLMEQLLVREKTKIKLDSNSVFSQPLDIAPPPSSTNSVSFSGNRESPNETLTGATPGETIVVDLDSIEGNTEAEITTVSYTHLTLPTTPYV